MQFPHLTDDQLNGCTQANMMQIQKYAFTGNKAEYDKLYYRQVSHNCHIRVCCFKM